MTTYTFDYDEAGRLQTVKEQFSRGSSSVSRYYYDAHDRLLPVHKRGSYGKTATTSYEYQTDGGEMINAEFAQSCEILKGLKRRG